ncbi:methyltransferase [Vallitalea longa]|uniref:Methyltransferase n=1 Tax=Vallitalea longa TaxID=2936439 RepID=A0A9W5YA07_9FIRM|nr:uroporphyrinogen decarboxylase family protein [Vallitalea longa]GKX29309.1 methyltransferase [Vallitalea longa]
MNSRERILAAIEHREPDKVPVDLGSTPSSNISAIAYNNLKKKLSINTGHTRVYDVVQQVVIPEDDIIDRFGVDVIDIGRVYNDKESDWYDYTLADGSIAQYPKWFKPKKADDGSYEAYHSDGTFIAKMPKGATFFDQTIFPYVDGYPDNYKNIKDAMDKVLWSYLVHSPWDHANEPDFWENLRKKAIELRNSTDKAIMIVCGCNLLEWGTFLRRIDNFLMDCYIDQNNVERLLDKLMEIHLDTLDKVCQSVGDVVDILRFGDDLGMDSGPLIGPDVYRKLFKPKHTMLCDYVHKHSNMKTFLHSCGSIHSLLPDLIEAGYDVINPVQTTANGMEPAVLKKEFGKDITFWGGGCNTRWILNRGTPEEVRKHVLSNLEIFSPSGGFVFNQEHNIMPDVPGENIIAMFDAVREFNGG